MPSAETKWWEKNQQKGHLYAQKIWIVSIPHGNKDMSKFKLDKWKINSMPQF